jgi:hypothetical protein
VSATDNTGVTGYLVNETATAPAAGAAGWSASAPTSYTFASAGSKTLYAWAKDSAGNVGGQSKVITITVADSIPPIVTLFSIPETSTSLTVGITSFTASDNVGVAGYMVTEGSTPPVATSANWISRAPTSHTFSGPGEKMLYAWAKDAAGNVSASKSSKTTISVADQDLSGMKVWQGKWFRVKFQKTEGESQRYGYLNIRSWDEAGQLLHGALYSKGETSQWESSELLLHFTSGVSNRFLGWFDYDGALTFVFRMAGTLGSGGDLTRAMFVAVGQAREADEEDATATADEQESGSESDRVFTLGGTMISANRVPKSITDPQYNDDQDSSETPSRERRIKQRGVIEP